MTIYENMRRIRLEHGMTQQQVADACGVRSSTYRSYESGRANPKPATVSKIAAALHTTAEELYGLQPGLFHPEQTATILQTMLADSGADTTECISQYNCLLLSYQKLNQKGRAEAVRRIAEMACLPEYQSAGEHK